MNINDVHIIILNKLSLVGMRLPDKYNENFDVLSEGPLSGGGVSSRGPGGPGSVWVFICFLFYYSLH